jgi:hypothetical protein
MTRTGLPLPPIEEAVLPSGSPAELQATAARSATGARTSEIRDRVRVIRFVSVSKRFRTSAEGILGRGATNSLL